MQCIALHVLRHWTSKENFSPGRRTKSLPGRGLATMLEMISPCLPYCTEPVNQTYQLRVSTFGRAVRHNQAEPCKHGDAAVLQLCLPLHVFASSVRQRKMGMRVQKHCCLWGHIPKKKYHVNAWPRAAKT